MPWLVYVTGGLAFGNTKTTSTDTTENTLSASNSDLRWGWVAGDGIEYKFNQNWSLRTEYLHTDFGRASVSGVTLDGNTYNLRDHRTDYVVGMRVNYIF